MPNIKSQSNLLYIIGIIILIIIAGVFIFQQIILPKLSNRIYNGAMDAAMDKLTSTDFTTAKTTPFSFLIENEGAAILINTNSGILDIDGDNESQTVTGEIKYFESEPLLEVKSKIDTETNKEGTIITMNSNNQQVEKYTIHLLPDKPSAFHINMGIGNINLNLRNTLTEYLNANIGGGKIDVTFSDKTNVEANFSAGTGSINLNIPESIGKNIIFSQGIPTNLNFGNDFVKTDKGFKSRNYDSAQFKADITMNQGLGGFTINPIE